LRESVRELPALDQFRWLGACARLCRALLDQLSPAMVVLHMNAAGKGGNVCAEEFAVLCIGDYGIPVLAVSGGDENRSAEPRDWLDHHVPGKAGECCDLLRFTTLNRLYEGGLDLKAFLERTAVAAPGISAAVCRPTATDWIVLLDLPARIRGMMRALLPLDLLLQGLLLQPAVLAGNTPSGSDRFRLFQHERVRDAAPGEAECWFDPVTLRSPDTTNAAAETPFTLDTDALIPFMAKRLGGPKSEKAQQLAAAVHSIASLEEARTVTPRRLQEQAIGSAFSHVPGSLRFVWEMIQARTDSENPDGRPFRNQIAEFPPQALLRLFDSAHREFLSVTECCRVVLDRIANH